MTKNIIKKNGITEFLTTNSDSYHAISNQLEDIMIKKLNINQAIASSIHFHQVYTWAKGAIPKSIELQALAYLEFKDSNKWMDVYIPSNKVALYILNDYCNKLLDQAFKNPKKLDYKLINLNYTEVIRIIENPKDSMTHKATAFIYLLYRHYLAYLSKTTSMDIVPQFSEVSKNQIQNLITKMLANIVPTSKFCNQLTQAIRNNLTLEDFENGLVARKVKKLLLPYIFELFE